MGKKFSVNFIQGGESRLKTNAEVGVKYKPVDKRERQVCFLKGRHSQAGYCQKEGKDMRKGKDQNTR